MLTENHWAADQSLHHLQEHHTHEWEALEGLIKVHRELDKADKAARKSLKNEIDQRRKGLEMLKERILHYEAQLRQEPSEGSALSNDGQIHHGAQAKAAPAPVANDAPSENTEIQALDPSPATDQAQAMEVAIMPPALANLAQSPMRMTTYYWGCLQVGRQRWSQV